MTKKLVSLLLAFVLLLSLALPVFAEDNKITVELNKENVISLKSGQKATFTLELMGKYSVITTGSKNVVINKITTFGSSTTLTPLAESENGNIFEYGAYGISFLNQKATVNFEASSKDGKPVIFKLYVISTDPEYTGFTSMPTSTKSYKEDIDFTVNKDNSINFINQPDFKGAVFSINDSSNTSMFTFKDNDVQNVLLNPVYVRSTGTITYLSVYSTLLSRNNSLTLKAIPNHVASASVVSSPNADKVYHFGKDGVIKGSLGAYAFIPAINLEGVEILVTYKDDSTESLMVNKDSNGYYVKGRYGRIDVTNETKITSNSTGTVNGTVLVGSCKTTMPVKIEKATFFETIVIFFGLLFGKYK